MRSPRISLLVLVGCLAGVARAAVPVGDVSGDGAVTVRDAVGRIVRANESLVAPDLDCNADGALTGDDVACIVNRALARRAALAIPVNENDAGLVAATTPEGIEVEFQGPKGGDGLAQGVQEIVVVHASGGVSIVHLDASGFPDAMSSPDGTTFGFDWSWPESLEAHVSTPGGIEADVHVPLGTTQGAAPSAVRQLDLPPAAGTVTLAVTACTRPAEGASTWLRVTRASGEQVVVAGQPTGSGSYAFRVPLAESVAGAGAQETCEAAANLLDWACTGLQVSGPIAQTFACPALAYAVSAVATPAAGALVFAACQAGLGGLALACDTIGFSPVPGADSVLATACPDVGESVAILDRHLEGDVTLQATAVVAGHGSITTPAQAVPATGPFPGFALAFDDCREDCANHADDDGDTLVDCADSDCSATAACLETNCGNDVDDDGDSVTDCADPDCVASPDCSGSPLEDCDNGVDDNADGDVDCDDIQCWFAAGCGFEWLCDDNRDDDLDGAVDCADADCEFDPACEAPTENCFNGVDDDADGHADCDDTECASLPACTPDEVCDNDIDDDRDGHVDCDDIACAGTPACGEHACDNLQDDDHDDLTDCADPDCACGENCSNGQDDNANGLVDCDDPACVDAPGCTTFEDCSNASDDDGDGLVDCDDDSCAGDPSCQEQLYCACFFDTSPPSVNDWWWHCWQTTNPDGWPSGYIVSPGECQCGPDIYTICH